MNINENVQKLRKVAFLLFIFPAASLLGALIFHNYFVSFKFSYAYDYKFLNNTPGSIIEYECSTENIFCEAEKFNKFKKINDCYDHSFKKSFYINNLEVSYDDLRNINSEKKFITKLLIIDSKNPSCIKNTSSYKLYNIVPFIFESTAKLRVNKKTTFGTSKPVNPLFYGESSISNIVKRFPVNYIFKPLMYISIFLMLIYWVLNNRIFNEIIKKSKVNFFYIFGIFSALFLFLHVLLLGSEIQNITFVKIRRSVIVFFILFEILAQFFLVREIYSKKKIITKYTHLKIIYLKVIFIFLVIILSTFIICLLALYDLPSKIDYVLEWNYFLLLLIFYFLSSIMWKKN